MGNNNNFRHISDGINLVPNATTEILNPGDIDYSSDTGEFNFFTGSGPDHIVGQALTQTLTNKTIPLTSNTITSSSLGFASIFDPTTGNLEASITTSTELGFVHSVTSNIQTQLNALVGAGVTSLNTLTGALTIAGSSSIQVTPSGSSLIISVNPAFPGTGTVTSVALADGSTIPIYSISGSPVTSSGTLTETLINQNPNLVFAGPSSGSAAQPTFRSLVPVDLPPIVILINLYDNVDTTLPTTTSTLIDGQTIVTGNLVLFSNLATGNNQIYQATVTGPSVSWMLINSPISGAQVFIQSGNLFTDQNIIFNGTSWSISGILGSAGYGTSGQILTSNGTTSAPTFQTPGGGSGTPSGVMMAFAGPKVSTPVGYLYCDGSLVSRTTYATLFGVIGTGWGSGDGSTTFNLPDTRGLFLRGQNDGSGRDPDVAGRTALNAGGNTGDNVGSYEGYQIQSHTHLVQIPGAQNVAFGNPPTNIVETDTGPATSDVAIGSDATGGSETRPININVVYIIKT
jgi:microcystin-dependent protein